MPPPPSVYRFGSLGKALSEKINELVETKKLAPELGNFVMKQYDKVTHGQIGKLIKGGDDGGSSDEPDMTVIAALENCHSVDHVFTLLLKDVVLTMKDGEEIKLDWLQVGAMPVNRQL
ncbi:hypothetical protein B0T24DRAFT_638236 [Lasiosphaeria ovina]|uniref:Transcription initiation factor IIA gamma subunit N-terminal domain-containing protein n=1 Tax=Lasiosphaeria ovina TaxID=92902 RepID=A0AAE0N0C5_9PEZI|nr:hypothetical protein B0T24DRAFT_638236 [Lasiosphaeria ovina]